MRAAARTVSFIVLAVAMGCGEDAPVPSRRPLPRPPEGEPAAADAPAGDSALAAELEALRAAHGVPALAALELRDGTVTRAASVGRRRVDGDDAVTPWDRWHLGSCAKPMTAALAGILADDGAVQWDATLAELFADVEVHPQLRDATLAELLRMRAGIPGDDGTFADYEVRARRRANPRAARAAVARALLRRPPEEPRGDYRYSNLGYVLAAAALERATGRSFETLLRERLFAPLQMRSCGFGAPDLVDEGSPVGHEARDGILVPMPGRDNAPLRAPAGTVHCSIADWARFVAWWMDDDATPSLSRDSRAQLRAVDGGFAAGWAIRDTPRLGETVYWSSGSNGHWLAEVWAAPSERRALFAITNAATEGASAATGGAIEALLQRR